MAIILFTSTRHSDINIKLYIILVCNFAKHPRRAKHFTDATIWLLVFSRRGISDLSIAISLSFCVNYAEPCLKLI